MNPILLRSLSSLALGSTAVFGYLIAVEARTPLLDWPTHSLADAAYVPTVEEFVPRKVAAWVAPAPQARGREWIYDAFTPPEIFYSARAKQFTIKPPDSFAAREREEPFGLELVAVRREPFRLQLLGYAGEEGSWRGTFENKQTGEIFVAGGERHLPELGLTIQSVEVRMQPIAWRESMTTQQRIAIAVVHDEREKRDVTLMHHERNLSGAPLAVVSVTGESDSRQVRIGDTLKLKEASYRIERLEVAPPSLEVAKERADGVEQIRRRLLPRGSRGFGPSD